MPYEPELGWGGRTHPLSSWHARVRTLIVAGDTDVSASVITEYELCTFRVILQLEWKCIRVRRQLWRARGCMAYHAFSSIRWIDGGRGVCVTTWAGHTMQLRVWF